MDMRTGTRIGIAVGALVAGGALLAACSATSKGADSDMERAARNFDGRPGSVSWNTAGAGVKALELMKNSGRTPADSVRIAHAAFDAASTIEPLTGGATIDGAAGVHVLEVGLKSHRSTDDVVKLTNAVDRTTTMPGNASYLMDAVFSASETYSADDIGRVMDAVSHKAAWGTPFGAETVIRGVLATGKPADTIINTLNSEFDPEEAVRMLQRQ